MKAIPAWLRDKSYVSANLSGAILVSMPVMQALYIDGELIEQAPQLSIESVLEAVGVPVKSYFLSSPCNPSVRRGVFPIKLDRVILEDDVYVSATDTGQEGAE